MRQEKKALPGKITRSLEDKWNKRKYVSVHVRLNPLKANAKNPRAVSLRSCTTEFFEGGNERKGASVQLKPSLLKANEKKGNTCEVTKL